MSTYDGLKAQDLAEAFSSLGLQPLGEILIAVVGVTGSGKSRFLRMVTQNNDIVVGENLDSETSIVEAYPFYSNGLSFVLIDTPGFDDSGRDDEDIFNDIAQWLKTSYESGQRLTGLLYLHRIIDNRQKGSEIRNLRMFQKICGENNFGNVVLGITFWDQEEPEVAASKEKELCDTPEFWGDMIARGSRVVRIPHNRREGIKLLEEIAKNKPVTLCVQDELVEQGLTIFETTAATAILHSQELKAVREEERKLKEAAEKQHHEELERLKRESAAKVEREERMFRQLRDRQRREAQALAALKRQQESNDRELALARAKRREEMEKQAKEMADMKERTRQLRIQAEKDESARLRKLQIAKETRRSTAHSESLQSQLALSKRCAGGGRRVQAFNEGHFQKILPYTFCDHCMKPPSPGGDCWNCNKCYLGSSDLYFMMCNSCYILGNKCWCQIPTTLTKTTKPSIPELSQCTRAKNGAPAGLVCDNCRVPPGSLYFHCCGCADDFDLCVRCWGVLGATCRRPLIHTLTLFGWYSPAERMP